MSVGSPTAYLLWAILSCIFLAYLVEHLWIYDRFQCLKWTAGRQPGAFKRVMTYSYLATVPLLIVYSIAMTAIKFNEGYIVLPNGQVLPKPIALYQPSDRHWILPLYFVLSVAWSLELVTHLEELTFWLYLLNQGPAKRPWFHSWEFRIWYMGSTVAVLGMPLITLITRRNLETCLAWVFVAGTTAGTSTTICFLYVLGRFPEFIRLVKTGGAEPDVVVRLATFYQLNKIRVIFRFLFTIPLMILAVDGLHGSHSIILHPFSSDFLFMIGGIGCFISSAITLLIFFPRSITNESGYKAKDHSPLNSDKNVGGTNGIEFEPPTYYNGHYQYPTKSQSSFIVSGGTVPLGLELHPRPHHHHQQHHRQQHRHQHTGEYTTDSGYNRDTEGTGRPEHVMTIGTVQTTMTMTRDESGFGESESVSPRESSDSVTSSASTDDEGRRRRRRHGGGGGGSGSDGQLSASASGRHPEGLEPSDQGHTWMARTRERDEEGEDEEGQPMPQEYPPVAPSEHSTNTKSDDTVWERSPAPPLPIPLLPPQSTLASAGGGGTAARHRTPGSTPIHLPPASHSRQHSRSNSRPVNVIYPTTLGRPHSRSRSDSQAPQTQAFPPLPFRPQASIPAQHHNHNHNQQQQQRHPHQHHRDNSIPYPNPSLNVNLNSRQLSEGLDPSDRARITANGQNPNTSTVVNTNGSNHGKRTHHQTRSGSSSGSRLRSHHHHYHHGHHTHHPSQSKGGNGNNAAGSESTGTNVNTGAGAGSVGGGDGGSEGTMTMTNRRFSMPLSMPISMSVPVYHPGGTRPVQTQAQSQRAAAGERERERERGRATPQLHPFVLNFTSPIDLPDLSRLGNGHGSNTYGNQAPTQGRGREQRPSTAPSLGSRQRQPSGRMP